MTDGDNERSPAGAPASPAKPESNWTASRVIGLVFTSIAGLIGLALLLGGIAVLAAYAFGRDDDGYFNTDRKPLRSATFAITTVPEPTTLLLAGMRPMLCCHRRHLRGGAMCLPARSSLPMEGFRSRHALRGYRWRCL